MFFALTTYWFLSVGDQVNEESSRVSSYGVSQVAIISKVKLGCGERSVGRAGCRRLVYAQGVTAIQTQVEPAQ